MLNERELLWTLSSVWSFIFNCFIKFQEHIFQLSQNNQQWTWNFTIDAVQQIESFNLMSDVATVSKICTPINSKCLGIMTAIFRLFKELPLDETNSVECYTNWHKTSKYFNFVHAIKSEIV